MLSWLGTQWAERPAACACLQAPLSACPLPLVPSSWILLASRSKSVVFPVKRLSDLPGVEGCEDGALGIFLEKLRGQTFL